MVLELSSIARFGLLSASVFWPCWPPVGLPARTIQQDFRDRVAPIFERHCVRCHQGEKAKGGLVLSDAAHALAGAKAGRRLFRASPMKACWWTTSRATSPRCPKMPRRSSPTRSQAIRHWIEAGAVWPAGMTLADKHEIDANWWSLKPLGQHKVPQVDSTWVRTPIDAFVLDKLRQNGLEPSAEADRRTLIRRLTYDLHGLPPTPDEIDAFVADPAADAYERLVDRLLASPRYGERWARHWLDVVHYGETHGYDKDKTRPNAWPYRDYVIAALNQDKPYGRFILGSVGRRRSVSRRAGQRRGHGLHCRRSVGRRRAHRVARGDGRQGDRPQQRPRRHGGDHLFDLSQPDGPLRPLPQSQVRSDQANRLLPSAGGLRRHRPGRPPLRSRSARGPTRAARCWLAHESSTVAGRSSKRCLPRR